MTMKIIAADSNQQYVWIGDRERNVLQTVNSTQTANTTEQQYAFNNPEVFYYWKPLSLDLNIALDFKSAFYYAVNLNSFAGVQQGNKDGGTLTQKDWQAPIISNHQYNKPQLEVALSQWANVANIDSNTKTVYFAYVSDGVLGGQSGRTYVGGGAHANEAVILIPDNHKYKDVPDNTNNLSLGTWGGWTAMHELGHVLGTPHPNPLYQDMKISIMAYPVGESFVNSKIPLTPGMQDINALQLRRKPYSRRQHHLHIRARQCRFRPW